MEPSVNDEELNAQIAERFKSLPKVVQDAISSADVQEHLRKLADSQKLHIDQWQLLENEVMLTLLGFQATDELKDNIKREVGVSDEVASSLSTDISKIVFEPIRDHLESNLEQSEAQAADTKSAPIAAAPAVAPATPPPAPPTVRVERAPISAAYKAGEPSTARASIEDDPYREPPK